MGDINLLGMIRKIKNSLSGFISTSDKATKSKFGIVKVGDNISVASGTISVPIATEETYGVVKDTGASGFDFEELWNGNITTTATDYELSKAYTGYKMLFLQSVPSATATRGGDIMVVSLMTTASNGINYMKAGAVDVEVKIVDGTHFNMKAGQGLNGVHLFGIK